MLPINFFETFPGSIEKTITMIGHRARLRDVMGQSYSIYPCTRAYHAHY